jgi:hypothetical protein
MERRRVSQFPNDNPTNKANKYNNDNGDNVTEV